MFQSFARLEKNLGLAGLLLGLLILGSVALALVLAELGANANIAQLFVWGGMPFVAWLMSKAARAQGKNPWLYGLASMLPPLAIFLFLSLYNQAVIAENSARYHGHDA